MQDVTHYAHYDSGTGEFLGFYADDIDSAIPIPAIPLTHDEWQTAMSIGANKVVNGELIYEEPVLSAEEQEAINRHWRDLELRESDRYMVPDRPLSEIEKQEVLDYRAALRDYPTDWVKPSRPVCMN